MRFFLCQFGPSIYRLHLDSDPSDDARQKAILEKQKTQEIEKLKAEKETTDRKLQLILDKLGITEDELGGS